jgi:glucans biosynthesis protein C
MQRLCWTDNLRATMIILVVMIHAGVTYSGLGSWYYVENEKVDMGSTIFFAFFQTFTQAYFMSLLFLVSGYFTQKSLEKKSSWSFLSGRLYRLGVPLLVYIFILHPLSVKLAYPEIDLPEYYKNGILHLRFLSWTGPLWFVEALLIFTLLYMPVSAARRHRPLALSFKITVRNIILLILFISLFAFSTRLVFPIGSDVTNLQLGFFPAYIVMFFAGTVVFKKDLFEQINIRMAKHWLIASLALGIPAWLLIIIFGGPLDGVMLIEGGWNWPAFFYALWEAFFCVTFSISLIGIFKHMLNKQNSFQHFLSDNAFGVFVFHAPILIGTSILVKSFALPPVAKFFLVSALAISVSFIFSWMIRQIKPLKNIFS